MAEHKGRDAGVSDVGGATPLADAPDGIGPAPAHEPKPETLAMQRVEPEGEPVGAAASPNPPQISLAPIKKLRAQFNPLADGLVYLVVFIGGFVGTAARYGLSALWPAHDTGFPVATFVANMVACLLFSLLTETMASASWLRRRVRQLASRGLGLGLCGGLSTMSTVMLEGLRDILGHDPWMVVSYMLASMVGGVLCCVAGVCLAHVFTASRAAQSMRRMSLGSGPAHGGSHAKGAPSHGAHAVKANQGAVAVGVGPGEPVHPGDRAGAGTGAGAGAVVAADGMPASFEPTPITAEIPMVPDPVTGEVH